MRHSFSHVHTDYPVFSFYGSWFNTVDTTLYFMYNLLVYLISNFNIFFIFSSYEKVLVLREKSHSEFSSNLYILRSPESEKTVFTKVSICLSGVCEH